MRRAPFVLALFLAAALGAPSRSAYAQTPPHKFGRGLANLGLGMMEVPAQIAREGRRRGPFWAASLGFARGVGGFVERELVGLWEVVTFPAPIPRGYLPILSPEYPWELFE
jgi:putative exosortase-associated protein (TIGR04073 family)